MELLVFILFFYFYFLQADIATHIHVQTVEPNSEIRNKKTRNEAGIYHPTLTGFQRS